MRSAFSPSRGAGAIGHRAHLVAPKAGVSERKLQVCVLLAFASGVLVSWQANRLRRRYLNWRKQKQQEKLAAMLKELDLA